MESLLGFQDETIAVVGDDQEKSTSSSYGYKLVPWLNWNEWECVRDSLFSDSPEKIHSAITRVRHNSLSPTHKIFSACFPRKLIWNV
jgi:ribosomal biogenesis protein LAS1